MSKYEGEQVLVIPRQKMDQIAHFQGFVSDLLDEKMLQLFSNQDYFFMDRAKAEEDSNYKQLIPYCVFHCGGQILHYQRGKSGGENRLHAKISIGVGGHINPIDHMEGCSGYEMYMQAVVREIEEELKGVTIQNAKDVPVVAWINDDSNPVGQVHLGIVHLIELKDQHVTSREDALMDLKFSSIEALSGELYERLETWSQLALDCIKQDPAFM